MRGVSVAVPPSAEPEEVAADFAAFFAEAEPRLRRALVARLGGERGREAAAEAMAWGYEHWDDVQLMGNAVGYLYRVGVSRTRERKPVPASRLRPVAGSGPEEPVAGIEPEVWAALSALSDNQRVAVVLVHGYGWTMQEVGELLEVAVPTVGTHLRRGLANVRRRLGLDLADATTAEGVDHG